eukprot:CAMPEP_0179073828 /NCGR_PEP_ID=MMETSP0796-20121207/32773_1 /TAXON_ID=73915 /ORGANISM="Pyrodinium bahamense, Strain pbaha01" /LENGTH=518 /DNA_ID=CAMNT_0020771035 /DNA_START=108 /DNA_END=1665 /DNA_ORIENTATION=+
MRGSCSGWAGVVPPGQIRPELLPYSSGDQQIRPDLLRCSSGEQPIPRSMSHVSKASENSIESVKEAARAEWTRHLQRRVTQELDRRQLKRNSTPKQTGTRPSNKCYARFVSLMESTAFQCFCAADPQNVVFIGHASNVSMANALATPPQEEPTQLRFGNIFFTIVYIIELVLRLAAFRWNFFVGVDWKWNAFDTLLVISSVVEQVALDAGIGSFRLLSALRLFRVLRIIRVMRFFPDLRLMVGSIIQSLGALSWALLLLTTIMYLFSIVFMHGAILYLHEEQAFEADPVVRDGVVLWYSSVTQTMYTLLTAITGGISWADAVQPLEPISFVYRYLWSFYIVFVVIGVLNVLTGIFVERACELSGLDKDLVIQSEKKRNETFLVEMKKIFEEADADGSGTISWDEFKGYLENDDVTAYLATQQLDAFDARTLFDILNVRGEPEISIEAFIVGCQRLKGMAKGVDVVAVLQETRSMNRNMKRLMKKLTPQEGGPLGSSSSTPTRMLNRGNRKWSVISSLE